MTIVGERELLTFRIDSRIATLLDLFFKRQPEKGLQKGAFMDVAILKEIFSRVRLAEFQHKARNGEKITYVS